MAPFSRKPPWNALTELGAFLARPGPPPAACGLELVTVLPSAAPALRTRGKILGRGSLRGAPCAYAGFLRRPWGPVAFRPVVTRSRYREEARSSLCAFCPLHPQNEAPGITPVALAAGGSEQCLAQMQHF